MENRRAATRQAVITQEEWLKELERFSKKNDAGSTLRELSEMWGCSSGTTGERLRELHRLGKLLVGRRNEIRIDGRPHAVPVYRLKKATR